MKRFAALFLVLCLTAACTALAETEAVRTVDLGDFTLGIDASVPYETYEKKHHQDVFHALPHGADDPTAEIAVGWRAEPLLTEEMTEKDVAFWADWALLYVQNDWAWIDETVACALQDAALIRIDGRQALSVVYTMTVTLKNSGIKATIWCRDALAGGVYGYYTFSYYSVDPEEPVPALDALLETVRWAE